MVLISSWRTLGRENRGFLPALLRNECSASPPTANEAHSWLDSHHTACSGWGTCELELSAIGRAGEALGASLDPG